MTHLTADIRAAIETAYDNGASGFGIRVMTGCVTVAVGDELGNSYYWNDNTCTDEMIDGTSALGFAVNFGEIDSEEEFNAVINQAVKIYGKDDQLVVIAGRHNIDEVHNDDGEIVISDATCIAIIKN